jgi:hypothetical protein
MKAQISLQDWERISAYLDGQLDDKTAKKVKRDLETRTELRKAFADLQRYKAIVKQVPMRRVRRNFTLKPEMVEIKPIPRLVPVFRLTSAVIAAIAVVLFAIDLVPSLTNFTAMAPKASGMTSAEAVPSTAPDIIYWNGQQNYISNYVGTATVAPGLGMGGSGGGYGGGGGGAAITSNIAPTAPSMAQPTETPLTSPSAGQVAVPPATKEGLTAGPTPAPTQLVTMPPSPTEIAMDQAIQSGADSPILGIPPADQQGKIIPAPGETLRQAATYAQPSRVLTFLGIGLLLLAAAGGIFSFVLARRR